MIFDLNQTGLRRIYRPWQIEVLKHFWNTNTSLTSREAYNHLKQKGIKTDLNKRNTVSRASIIYFLDDLITDGILTYTEKTGKGGYHRIYSLAPIAETEDKFKEYVFERFTEALIDFLAP